MDTVSTWIIDLVVWSGGSWMLASYFQEPAIPWWAIAAGLLILICCIAATLGLLAMPFIVRKCRPSGC